MTIPDLKAAWDEMGAAAKAGRQNDAETLFGRFEIIAKWSPDLVPADSKRLIEKARARLPSLQEKREVARSASNDEGNPLGSFASLALYAKEGG